MPPPSDQPPRDENPRPPFYTRYGFSRPDGNGIDLRIEPYPEICNGNQLKRTILISAVDLVASLKVREAVGTDVTFTSDLSLRAPVAGIPSCLEVRGEILREGRNLVTTEVRIETDGALFAFGESTFSRMPRKGPAEVRIEDLRLPRVFESHPLAQPLATTVGIEIVPDQPGLCRLPLRPELRNPEGILQGALVGLLIESAAESLAPPGAMLEEFDLRYLAAGKTGPIEAQASWLDSEQGAQGRGVLRVTLRDLGQGGRLTATAFVRVSDVAPGSLPEENLAIVST